MENKRTLIAEDQNMLKDIIGDLEVYRIALTAFKSSYATLDVGELDNDVFKEIMELGPSSLMDRFFNNINEEMGVLGLKKEAFRKPHLDNATETFNKFIESLTVLKNVNPDPHSMKRRSILQLKDISFFDGKFLVSAMDQENIMENHCRVYLNNSMEALLYSKLTVIRDSLNDFYTCLDEIATSNELDGIHTLDYIGSLKELSALHQFLEDEDVKQINPESIKWFSDMINRAKSAKEKSAIKQANKIQ